MILYHGTNQILNEIDFEKSRLRTDFGKGFYLSDKLGNARDWAVDKTSFSETPTVMRYNVNNSIFKDENVFRLRFDNPTIEWLNFVRDNRSRTANVNHKKEPRHSYDIVSGPIANDKVAIAVDKYCKEKLTADEALNEIKALKNVFQLSIHSKLALTFIVSVSYSQLINKRWNDWKSL